MDKLRLASSLVTPIVEKDRSDYRGNKAKIRLHIHICDRSRSTSCHVSPRLRKPCYCMTRKTISYCTLCILDTLITYYYKL